jgi:hypothetical protein
VYLGPIVYIQKSIQKALHSEVIKVWNALCSKPKTTGTGPQRMHGAADRARLFSKINADLKAHAASGAIQVFVADHIDRGPDSRRSSDVFLNSNREFLIAEFARNPESFATSRDDGGSTRCCGLPFQSRCRRPDDARRRYLKRSCGDFFFVHAGVRPGILCHSRRRRPVLDSERISQIAREIRIY